MGIQCVSSSNRLSKQLKGLGYMEKEVIGDGNCLFRAVCDQLEGNDNNYATIRHSVCNYMERNEKDFVTFLEENIPFSVYIRRMRIDGFWGGNIELYAVSKLYNVNIMIHILNRPSIQIKNDNLECQFIHLSYNRRTKHYNSVIPKPNTDANIKTN